MALCRIAVTVHRKAIQQKASVFSVSSRFDCISEMDVTFVGAIVMVMYILCIKWTRGECCARRYGVSSFKLILIKIPQ
jgi:hypothetical protein